MVLWVRAYPCLAYGLCEIRRPLPAHTPFITTYAPRGVSAAAHLQIYLSPLTRPHRLLSLVAHLSHCAHPNIFFDRSVSCPSPQSSQPPLLPRIDQYRLEGRMVIRSPRELIKRAGQPHRHPQFLTHSWFIGAFGMWFWTFNLDGLWRDAGLLAKDEVDGTITGVLGIKALDRSDECNCACCSFAELP